MRKYRSSGSSTPHFTSFTSACNEHGSGGPLLGKRRRTWGYHMPRCRINGSPTPHCCFRVQQHGCGGGHFLVRGGGLGMAPAFRRSETQPPHTASRYLVIQRRKIHTGERGIVGVRALLLLYLYYSSSSVAGTSFHLRNNPSAFY